MFKHISEILREELPKWSGDDAHSDVEPEVFQATDADLPSVEETAR